MRRTIIHVATVGRIINRTVTRHVINQMQRIARVAALYHRFLRVGLSTYNLLTGRKIIRGAELLLATAVVPQGIAVR